MIVVITVAIVCGTCAYITKIVLAAQTESRLASNTQDFELLKQEVKDLSRAFNLGKLR